MALCTCKNLTFHYPKSLQPALDSICLDIMEGEFIVLCGTSGCGKTTLLRHLKPALSPFGTKHGEILFEGKQIMNLSEYEAAINIGYVMQQPEHQIVTDKVWHELAFGLENIGCPQRDMERKIAEMATFFGMERWYHQDTDALSGGQKQMLNLASIMLLQPKLLLLDEPTSQLDPIAAKEFLHILQKLNTELGTTIVMAEHHLEEAFALADRIVVMQQGKILCENNPQNIANDLANINPLHPMFQTFPTPIRLYRTLKYGDVCPIHVRDGRRYLQTYFNPSHEELAVRKEASSQPCIFTLKDVHFRYDYHEDDVLRGVNLTIYAQDIFVLLGANGAGKSTLLNILSGLHQPYRGSVTYQNHAMNKKKNTTYFERIGYVPQDTSTMFVKDNIQEDLMALCNHQIDKASAYTRLQKWIKAFHLEALLAKHPYDISGGEQQRLAMCKVLLRDVDVLILDEPTKGLDAFMKAELAHILQQLKAEGMSIIIVSHDIEFSASYATRVALLFDGRVLAQDDPQNFFKGNQFYTTAAHRMAKGFYDDAITCEEVVTQCRTHLK